MCGIAGYFGSRTIPHEAAETCLRLMHHRGPDYAAHRRWESNGTNVLMLFTRLSIIDLDDRAAQPFQIGPQTMIFNGELYNYVELRQQLMAEGCTFRTDSDTEVLLRHIATAGWEGLDACEGMWAVAIYDERDGSLTLSRDRFGEKPLYLYRDESGLYFGSEVKFIQALCTGRLTINIDHLYRYLINGYKSLYKNAQNFFNGITDVPAAGIVRFDANGREQTTRFWEPAFRPDETMSYEDAVDGARERLIRAMELRLRADVPLAFCMSGGIDSNSLIAIAKNIFGYDVHGFTIVNDDARYDEREMVDCMVEALAVRHTAIPVSPDRFLEKLRRLVRQHDAPVSTITYYAHWLLMESIAAHGYRVAVSGTAADELFTGYYDHHLAYLYEVRNDPELYAHSRQAWETHILPVVRNPFLRNPNAFVETPELRDHIFLDADRFATFLRHPWSEPFAERQFTPSLLRNRMMNEMFHENVPVILHEDDLNAMDRSIENRSPYLDRQLFDFCYRIPTRHLVRDGKAKAILRDAMAGIVPAPVLENRRKVGFNAPIFSFLNVDDPETRGALLDDSPIFDHVRRDRIETLLTKEDLRNSESKFLFYFLNSKMFLEEFAA